MKQDRTSKKVKRPAGRGGSSSDDTDIADELSEIDDVLAKVDDALKKAKNLKRRIDRQEDQSRRNDGCWC